MERSPQISGFEVPNAFHHGAATGGLSETVGLVFLFDICCRKMVFHGGLKEIVLTLSGWLVPV